MSIGNSHGFRTKLMVLRSEECSGFDTTAELSAHRIVMWEPDDGTYSPFIQIIVRLKSKYSKLSVVTTDESPIEDYQRFHQDLLRMRNATLTKARYFGITNSCAIAVFRSDGRTYVDMRLMPQAGGSWETPTRASPERIEVYGSVCRCHCVFAVDTLDATIAQLGNGLARAARRIEKLRRIAAVSS